MSFSRSCALLCSLMLQGIAFAGVAPEPETISEDEQIQLTRGVRDLFEAKCTECHGAEMPRPKGKFGYILDLRRVADNPDYIVRGDPGHSELYSMVLHNEMPGEDANVPPLTLAEKETVRRWIEIGAPDALPTSVPDEPIVSPEPVPPPPAPPPPASLPLWKMALRWFGRFHPLSTHFPVALMYVAVLAEAFSWWTRRESWLQTVRFLVLLAGVSAVASVGLGWVNASFTSYVGKSASILQWHRWLGTFTGAWSAGCAVLLVMSECREGSPERQRFRGALLVGAALIGVTGFLGSALIYGLDHYSWN